jgi:hypothetical protein
MAAWYADERPMLSMIPNTIESGLPHTIEMGSKGSSNDG